MLKKVVALCLTGYLVFAGANLFAAGDASTGKQLASGCKCHRGELEGWPEDKLVQTLQAFKSGERINKFMNKKAATLSDQDIEDLAAWFARQTK